MTLLDAAYNLAKVVQRTDNRERLRSVIGDLNRSDPSGKPELDRGQFGYFARQQRCQTLGYLLVDLRRESLPFKLTTLSDNERSILGEFHAELVSLNRACVAKLTGSTAVPWQAIDPYSLFDYAEIRAEDQGKFIPEEQRTIFVNAFEKHVAFRQVISTTPSGAIPPADYVRGVVQLARAIESAGVHDARDEIVKLVMHEPPDSPQRGIFRHLAAIVSLRASLGVLDQLLFQAVLSDKLPIAGDENVIGVEGPSKTIFGEALTVRHIADTNLFLRQPGDLVLIMKNLTYDERNRLAMIFGSKFSFSEEAGTTGELSMRLVDDQLNPYGGLIRD